MRLLWQTWISHLSQQSSRTGTGGEGKGRVTGRSRVHKPPQHSNRASSAEGRVHPQWRHAQRVRWQLVSAESLRCWKSETKTVQGIGTSSLGRLTRCSESVVAAYRCDESSSSNMGSSLDDAYLFGTLRGDISTARHCVRICHAFPIARGGIATPDVSFTKTPGREQTSMHAARRGHVIKTSHCDSTRDQESARISALKRDESDSRRREPRRHRNWKNKSST